MGQAAKVDPVEVRWVMAIGRPLDIEQHHHRLCVFRVPIRPGMLQKLAVDGPLNTCMMILVLVVLLNVKVGPFKSQLPLNLAQNVWAVDVVVLPAVKVCHTWPPQLPMSCVLLAVLECVYTTTRSPSSIDEGGVIDTVPEPDAVPLSAGLLALPK